jgi:hypothetical protein
MTIIDLSHRIELHFWDWAIPTLCASTALQKCVQYAYQFVRKTIPMRNYLIGGGVAFLGFSNGMFIYWLLTR